MKLYEEIERDGRPMVTVHLPPVAASGALESVGVRESQDGSGMIATGWTDGDPNGSDLVSDTEIRNIGLQLLLRNWGRMENGPDRCGNTDDAGADHAPSAHTTEGEVSTILPSLAGLTEYERRKVLIHLLDDARQRYIAARADRLELMTAAREYGMSCRDIGTVLGISEQSTRAQIKRAKAAAA